MLVLLLCLAFFTHLLNLLIILSYILTCAMTLNLPISINDCYTLTDCNNGPVTIKRADQGRHGCKVWFLFYRQIGQGLYQQTFFSVFPQISCITDLPSDVGEYK